MRGAVRRAAWLLVLGLHAAAALPAPASESWPLTTIALRERGAEELIPVLQPLLQGAERVGGEGTQLVLRASPRTLAALRKLVQGLDRPRRVFEVWMTRNPRFIARENRGGTTLATRDALRHFELGEGDEIVVPITEQVLLPVQAALYRRARGGIIEYPVLAQQYVDVTGSLRVRVGFDGGGLRIELARDSAGVATPAVTRFDAALGEWIAVGVDSRVGIATHGGSILATTSAESGTALRTGAVRPLLLKVELLDR